MRKLIIIIQIILVSISCFSAQIRDSDMKSGLESYNSGNYLDSIYHLNLVISKNNDLLTEAYYWKAKALYEMGLYKDSKNELELFFRKATIDTSYYEDSRFLYCKIFFKLGKYEDSLLLLNQFIRNKSFKYYYEPALFWLGETYLQLSKLDLAKETFNQYLKLKPDNKVVKERVRVIENMSSILSSKSSDSEITLLDKAGWLAEYIAKEQKVEKDSDNKQISNFLDGFNSKDDFFYWLDNYYRVSFKKNSEKGDIINDEEEVVAQDKLLDKTTVVIPKESIVKDSKEIIVQDKVLEKTTVVLPKEPVVKDVEESKELDYIEKALLDELELKLLEELGDGN